MSVFEALSHLRSTGQTILKPVLPPSASPKKRKLEEATAKASEPVIHSGLATPQKVPSASGPIFPISPDTPDTPLPKEVLAADIGSPMWYHSTDSLDAKLANPNKDTRKFIKNVSGKRVNTIACGSAKKDPEKIRNQNLKPDPNGVIEVPSASGPGSRLWSLHKENNPDGKNRLIPVKPKGGCANLIPLTGTDFDILIKTHNPKRLSFEDHVLSQIGPAPMDTSTASTSSSDRSSPDLSSSPTPSDSSVSS